MKNKMSLFLVGMALWTSPLPAEELGYHQIQTNSLGQLIPWAFPDPAKAYDQVIRAVLLEIKHSRGQKVQIQGPL